MKKTQENLSFLVPRLSLPKAHSTLGLSALTTVADARLALPCQCALCAPATLSGLCTDLASRMRMPTRPPQKSSAVAGTPREALARPAQAADGLKLISWNVNGLRGLLKSNKSELLKLVEVRCQMGKRAAHGRPSCCSHRAAHPP